MGALAMGADHLRGEPPARMHPVVAMGAYLRAAGARRPHDSPALELAAGSAAWLAGAATTTAAGLLTERLVARLPRRLRPLALAGALWPLLALRLLLQE